MMNDVAATPPLPELQRPQSTPNVRVDVAELSRYPIAHDAEEADPADQVPVHMLDAGVDPLPPVASRQLTNLLVDAFHAPLRQQHLDVAVLPLAKTEAEKVPLFGFGYRALRRVHFEPQATLDELDNAGHHAMTAAFAPDVDVAFIGVPHEVMTSSMKLSIELIQHDVRQQRRERAALRRALLCRHHHTVGHHNFGLQHLSNQQQHAFVVDAQSKPRNQTIMVHSIEELLQVEVHDVLAAVFQILAGLCDRRMATAAGSKTVAAVVKRQLVNAG